MRRAVLLKRTNTDGVTFPLLFPPRYVISVKGEKGSWEVKRRYNRFKQLHLMLKAQFPRMGVRRDRGGRSNTRSNNVEKKGEAIKRSYARSNKRSNTRRGEPTLRRALCFVCVMLCAVCVCAWVQCGAIGGIMQKCGVLCAQCAVYSVVLHTNTNVTLLLPQVSLSGKSGGRRGIQQLFNIGKFSSSHVEERRVSLNGYLEDLMRVPQVSKS